MTCRGGPLRGVFGEGARKLTKDFHDFMLSEFDKIEQADEFIEWYDSNVDMIDIVSREVVREMVDETEKKLGLPVYKWDYGDSPEIVSRFSKKLLSKMLDMRLTKVVMLEGDLDYAYGLLATMARNGS